MKFLGGATKFGSFFAQYGVLDYTEGSSESYRSIHANRFDLRVKLFEND